MHVLYMYVSGCLRAFVCSRTSWIWLPVCVFVCVWEREYGRFRQSLGVSYCDSVALDLRCLCCGAVLRICALLYRVVFLIESDVLQPMCTDWDCFGKPQTISPITALAVRLTFWICYSPLFELQHSLISCLWTTSVGLEWSACTLSQAQWRTMTVISSLFASKLWRSRGNQVRIETSSKLVKNGDF